MKKHFLTLITFAIFNTVSLAQVGINSDNSAPSPSAMLDLKSSDKGLLIPRLTTIERNNITNPEIGLMVFDKDLQEIFIFNSEGWKQGTMSKLPLVLTSDKLNVIRVTNSLLDSYPNISTVAEFIALGNLGVALKARSSGNAPTIDARNESGSAISAHSENSTAGTFLSNLGIGISSYAVDNISIFGQNNSATMPSAKFTNNNSSGKAIETNATVDIDVNNLVGLKVTNNKLDSYPNTSTAAEFISKDILGYGVKAQSAGNPPTMYLSNTVGSGIESRSTGYGAGGYFSAETGVGISTSAKNNHAIIGSNNSSTLPTAKFINSGTGPAMELNSSLKVVTSNSIDEAAVRIQQTGIGGNAIYASSAGVSPTLKVEATSAGPAVYGTTNTSESGYFVSNSGRAVVGGTGDNYAFSGSNNSNTLPTAKFTNNGQGRALELNGNASIIANSLNSLYVENNKSSNTIGASYEAAGVFIDNSPNGTGLISNGNRVGISAGSNYGKGIQSYSPAGVAGHFYSQYGNAITGYSATITAIDMHTTSVNFPAARFRNHYPGGMALELTGNLKLNGQILNEAYQTPIFENSWTNFGAEWNTAKFYKGKDGRVYLEGVVTGGSGSVICTLPVGYRPASRIFFIVSHDGNGRGRIDIQANGVVSFDYGANRTMVGLDGISFRVE